MAGDALAGELWELKKERIRKASVYGNLPDWVLRSVSSALTVFLFLFSFFFLLFFFKVLFHLL